MIDRVGPQLCIYKYADRDDDRDISSQKCWISINMHVAMLWYMDSVHAAMLLYLRNLDAAIGP